MFPTYKSAMKENLYWLHLMCAEMKSEWIDNPQARPPSVNYKNYVRRKDNYADESVTYYATHSMRLKPIMATGRFRCSQ